MNERIRELAEQATVLSYRQYIDSGDHRFVQNSDAVQKFAELIVQECADFIKPLGDWRGGHGEPPMPSTSELAKRLKEHFGVQE
jgi:hypothetical protein